MHFEVPHTTAEEVLRIFAVANQETAMRACAVVLDFPGAGVPVVDKLLLIARLHPPSINHANHVR